MQRSTSLICLALLATGCARNDDYNTEYGADPSGSSDGYGYADSTESAMDTGSQADGEEEPTADTGETEDTAEPGECDEAEALTLYLSPDDSNSMSSPVQARAAILGGYTSLNQVQVRTWEFFNYYTFDYPQPTNGEDLGLTVDMVASPDNPEELVLQIGVKSPTPTERLPLNITLVLDTSGSMSGVPIDMLREASRSIAASLATGDIVSMVTWSATQIPILSGHPVTGPNDETLLSAINAIESGGGTDLSGGLEVGYGVAMDNHDAGRINRVVLISDGGANMGITDEEIIGKYAGTQDRDGIYMVGIGVGEAGGYNDVLMDNVTDAGKGASVFIPSAAEAEFILEDRFISTMDVFARDVAVSLDLPAGFEIVQFSGEEYSTDPSEIEPQHLSPDDAMVFYQTLGHCDAESLTGTEVIGVTVNYKDAITFESKSFSESYTIDELQGSDSALLLKGAAIYAYAEGLKAWQRGDQEAVLPMEQALERAEELSPSDADLAEIRSVIDALE